LRPFKGSRAVDHLAGGELPATVLREVSAGLPVLKRVRFQSQNGSPVVARATLRSVIEGFQSREAAKGYCVPPWAGFDLRGAEVAWRGLSDVVAQAALNAAEQVMATFRGKVVGHRKLDLQLATAR
jgi:hypothetical protein